MIIKHPPLKRIRLILSAFALSSLLALGMGGALSAANMAETDTPGTVAPQDLNHLGFTVVSQKNGKRLIVQNVGKKSQARKSGLRNGDVLLSIKGQAYRDSSSGLALLENIKPGNLARLTVARKGQLISVRVRAEKLN